MAQQFLKGFNTLSQYRRSGNGGRWVPRGTVGRTVTVVLASAGGQVAKNGGYVKNRKFIPASEVQLFELEGSGSHVGILETLADSMQIMAEADVLNGAVVYVPNNTYGALARLKRESRDFEGESLEELVEDYLANKTSDVQEGEAEAIKAIAQLLAEQEEAHEREHERFFFAIEALPTQATIAIWERAIKRNPQGSENISRSIIKQLVAETWDALPVQQHFEIEGIAENETDGDEVASF